MEQGRTKNEYSYPESMADMSFDNTGCKAQFIWHINQTGNTDVITSTPRGAVQPLTAKTAEFCPVNC